MLQAIEYIDLKALPDSHMLGLREFWNYEQKYKLSKYGGEQIGLCIIVPSRNNVADDRYRKVLMTIRQQNYSNYHIVFIDDASTDNTYSKTEDYLKEIRLFERTQMIQNERQRFATFNIQNAIHHYCYEKQVAVLLDGDDELIGRQVFQLINASYQKRDNWIVYFSFIGNTYMYGVSKALSESMFS